MRTRPFLAVLAVVTALLVAGCGEEAKKPVSGTASELQDPDPADPADESDGDDLLPDDVDTGDMPDIPDVPDTPDISGFDCDVDVEVTGDVTGELEGGTAVTNNAGGPKAFYQALGEELLLSAYSEGDGIDPSLILQAGAETYGTDADTDGLDIREDGSGFTVDAEVALVPSGDKTARVTGTMSC